MDKLNLIYDLISKNEDKLSKIHDELIDINKTTIRNTENLEEHMRRTEIAEIRISKIEEKFTFSWLTKMMGTVVAFIGALGAIVGYLRGWF